MPETPPQVAIILPFRRANATSERCVAACLAQDDPNLRLILACEDPEGKSWDDPRVTVLATGPTTIAGRRNQALNAAPEVAWYAFIDSDAFPRQDWLHRGIQAFGRLPKDVWAVGGPNLPPPDEPWPARVVGWASQSFLVSGMRGYLRSQGTSRFSQDLPTCNLIVSGPALREMGGFCEELVGGEDQDLCNRILSRGGRIYFDREVVVYHENRPLLRPFLLQRLFMGYCGVLPILRRHPRLRNLYMLAPLVLVLILLGGMLGALVEPAWIPAVAALWGSFLALCLIQAARWAPPSAIPLTALALAVGCLAPGLGTLLALLGVRLDLRSRNRNDWLRPAQGPSRVEERKDTSPGTCPPDSPGSRIPGIPSH